MFEQPALHTELDAALRRVRHDLKTPLAVMKGYVDMMLRGMGGEPSPATRRYLERMSEAVRKELNLLDSYLGSPEGLLRAGRQDVDLETDSDAANTDTTLSSQSRTHPPISQASRNTL
jgi:signal transduction histidine kinase